MIKAISSWCVAAALLSLAGGAHAADTDAAASAPPADAKAAGFTVLTYDANADSGSAATKLYPWNFLKYRAGAFRKSGKVVELTGGGPYNAQVASASSTGPGTFEGVAFGGGGYFEATMQFQRPDESDTQTAWAAFWGMAVEHLAAMQTAVHWEGKEKDFEHFAELDIFEYNVHKIERQENVYGGSLIDWYGVWDKSCPKKFCFQQIRYRDKLRHVPPDTDFSKPHRYAALWVPATESTRGSVQWYFDGAPIGAAQTWRKARAFDQLSSPGDYSYAIIDRQHLVIMAGTGAVSPMKLLGMRVWQRGTSDNWYGK